MRIFQGAENTIMHSHETQNLSDSPQVQKNIMVVLSMPCKALQGYHKRQKYDLSSGVATDTNRSKVHRPPSVP